eukprot:3365298-Rhodomonas_salina.4
MAGCEYEVSSAVFSLCVRLGWKKLISSVVNPGAMWYSFGREGTAGEVWGVTEVPCSVRLICLLCMCGTDA